MTTNTHTVMPIMCGDRLLVRQDDAVDAMLENHEKLKEAGFELTDTTKEQNRPLEGTVLAISPAIFAHNNDADKTSIRLGDHVRFAAYASVTTININGEELTVLTIDDILCVDSNVHEAPASDPLA